MTWGPSSARVAELARLSGGRIAQDRAMASGERVQLAVFRDHMDKVRFFAALAREDAEDQDIQALARSIVATGGDRSELGRIISLHRWVRDHIQHIGEPVETVPRARQVAIDGVGDCDDTAVLLMALLVALGHEAGLMPWGSPPRHVCAGVRYQGRWYPLEVTIDALPGEHPLRAAERLGVTREDVGT